MLNKTSDKSIAWLGCWDFEWDFKIWLKSDLLEKKINIIDWLSRDRE